MGTKELGMNIICVLSPGNMFQIDHTHNHRLPHLIIGNSIVILIEGDVYDISTGYPDLIFSHNLGCSINGNHKHY